MFLGLRTVLVVCEVGKYSVFWNYFRFLFSRSFCWELAFFVYFYSLGSIFYTARLVGGGGEALVFSFCASFVFGSIFRCFWYYIEVFVDGYVVGVGGVLVYLAGIFVICVLIVLRAFIVF